MTKGTDNFMENVSATCSHIWSSVGGEGHIRTFNSYFIYFCTTLIGLQYACIASVIIKQRTCFKNKEMDAGEGFP